MRQTATQPIRSIGFSLAISGHFLIATLPGTNELPLNMDGWNTSLSEKGFQLFFRGKLLVSAREKNTSQPLKIELGYPTLCVIELTITHHQKELKNIESPKHVPNTLVSKAVSPLPVTPPKIKNLKMMVWKMFLLFQGCILRFHVNLARCTSCFNPSPIPV